MDQEKQTYVTHAELLDLTNSITNAIQSQTEAIDGLRTITLIIAAVFIKQERIDKKKLIDDVSDLIERNHAPEGTVPIYLLDFRATLIKQFNLDNGAS